MRHPFAEPSQPSDSQLPSHENYLTHEPEPEVALMQATEDPFALPAIPHSIIIIENTHVGTPLTHLPHSATPPQ
ncbi:hypothetical protein O181_068052 [Austropuccinia psidii MF-1]|uniref:Uncharacterized protein n=1 Tax=Austropuccinia psidii MF-1 TaxID=1389203 RepID=A0A9Q3EYL0_9BASI|nr:hypothetical protein [Austropuccinia psidii MF-1]